MSSLDEYYEGGPRTWNEAFPPICLRSHWDPTAVSKHVLPTPVQTQLALDPRQSVRICQRYYETGSNDSVLEILPEPEPPVIPIALTGSRYASRTPTSQVQPPGGAARTGFPYATYSTAIDNESKLRLLNLPQTNCATKKYRPTNDQPSVSIADNNVPGADPQTLSPFVTIVKSSTNCRAEDDQAAWDRSSRLFFNPTKYDRTQGVPASLKRAESLRTPY